MGFGIGEAIGIGGSILGLAINKDKRQLEQQERLQKLQIEGSKEMADYNKENALDIWNKTNSEAQMKHIKDAGLNPALMYGGGGAGGATTSGGAASMPTGATATDPSSSRQADMGMAMMAAQLGLVQAQTKKTEVEAAKAAGVDTEATKQGIEGGKQAIEESKARVTNQEFNNRMNELYGEDMKKNEWNISGISQEERNLKWEMYKSVAWGSGNVQDGNNNANKALRAEFERSVIELANAKKEGRLKDAQAVVEGFKANLAKEGFAPDSPWYVKTIETLLNKAGVHTSMITN